jgi:hypothetical protein
MGYSLLPDGWHIMEGGAVPELLDYNMISGFGFAPI